LAGRGGKSPEPSESCTLRHLFLNGSNHFQF
jgi:hypothetical protein